MSVVGGAVDEEREGGARKRQKQSGAQGPGQQNTPAVVPMLVSGGNDSRLFAFAAESFMTFYPHAFCPSPQPPPMALSRRGQAASLLLVQQPYEIDIWQLPGQEGNGSLKKRKKEGMENGTHGGGEAAKDPQGPSLIARMKMSSPEAITCSAVSPDGRHVAYSDSSKVRLFELMQTGGVKGGVTIRRCKVGAVVPPAHTLTFSTDSLHLIVATRTGPLLVNPKPQTLNPTPFIRNP